MLPWHHYLFGLIFLISGFLHFQKPNMYKRIIPPYIPAHSLMILLSGIVEMVLALMLLNKDTQSYAATGIIALLIIYLPVHVHMLKDESASMGLPKWVLVIRIPLQFALILWAYCYLI